MREWPGLTPGQRIAGVIATLQRGDEVAVRHFPGNGLAAVRDVAAFCDVGGWQVVTLSSPATIFRDLQGTRVAPVARDGRQRFGDGGDALPLPEHVWLGKIGRPELFAGRA